MMELSRLEIIALCILCLLSGGFGIAIAFGVGYLSLSKPVPRKIFWGSVLVQVALSVCIFVGITLWFYSQLTPESLPKDFITGATLAYFGAAVPEVAFGFFVLFLKITRRTIIQKFIQDKPNASEIKEELDGLIPNLQIKSMQDRHLEIEKRLKKSQKARQKTQSKPKVSAND